VREEPWVHFGARLLHVRARNQEERRVNAVRTLPGHLRPDSRIKMIRAHVAELDIPAFANEVE